jgi:hypothetical protein
MKRNELKKPEDTANPVKRGYLLQIRPSADVMKRFIRAKARQQLKTAIPLSDAAFHEQIFLEGLEKKESLLKE